MYVLSQTIYVTERSRSWYRDVRLRGGFELRCCLALSYLNVLKRFPNDNKDRNCQKGCVQLFSRKMVERLSESISLSELIQQRNVVALKQRVLFNIK